MEVLFTMERISRSDKTNINNFKDLVRYVTSPIHMILYVGTKGIFVEYFPEQRKIMIGNSKREIKLPKNEFDILLLFFDTLYENVKEIVVSGYDIGDYVDLGYVDAENKIYMLDLSGLSFDLFRSVTNASDEENIDDYIDLFNTIKLSSKSLIAYIEYMYDGF